MKDAVFLIGWLVVIAAAAAVAGAGGWFLAVSPWHREIGEALMVIGGAWFLLVLGAELGAHYRSRRKDSLLSCPLVDEAALAGWKTDLKADHPVTEEPFWPLVVAELNRRQINAQLCVARSLTIATWVLAGVTLVLVLVQLAPPLVKH